MTRVCLRSCPDFVRVRALGGSASRASRSKLGYRSLLLTGSMVGGLGVFGHDDAIGFAGEAEQGGRADFKAREVHDKVRKSEERGLECAGWM